VCTGACIYAIHIGAREVHLALFSALRIIVVDSQIYAFVGKETPWIFGPGTLQITLSTLKVKNLVPSLGIA